MHAIISILFPRIGRARPKDFSRGRKEALAEAGRRARKQRGEGRRKRQDETVEEMSKKEMAEADTRS